MAEKWHYFVGDIHGCYEEYMKIEAKILRHASRNDKTPLIVSVGDLVDRGPGSAAVVQHFRKGFHEGTHAAVLGNHEAFMLQTMWEFCPWDEAISPFPHALPTIQERHELGEGSAGVLQWSDYRIYCKCLWLAQGGHETLLSFGCDPHETDTWTLSEEDMHFLAQLPIYWESEDFIVTHAMAHRETLEFAKEYESLEAPDIFMQEAYQAACYELIWERDEPDLPPDPERMHISGHTTFSRVRHNRKKKFIRIDTACVYGGRLTAWCGESGTLFRTPAID